MDDAKTSDVGKTSARPRPDLKLERIVVRFESYQLTWIREQANRKCLKVAQFIRFLVEEARNRHTDGNDVPTSGPTIKNPLRANPFNDPEIVIDDDL